MITPPAADREVVCIRHGVVRCLCAHLHGAETQVAA